VANALRPADAKDAYGAEQAKTALEKIYGWLDGKLAGRTWAAGDDFSLADCAGAPSLFYADWVHEIGPAYANLRAYRARVLARPSVARCVEEGRKYRAYFPLGAPDRD
jgi:glutathione S-transferase